MVDESGVVQSHVGNVAIQRPTHPRCSKSCGRCKAWRTQELFLFSGTDFLPSSRPLAWQAPSSRVGGPYRRPGHTAGPPRTSPPRIPRWPPVQHRTPPGQSDQGQPTVHSAAVATTDAPPSPSSDDWLPCLTGRSQRTRPRWYSFRFEPKGASTRSVHAPPRPRPPAPPATHLASSSLSECVLGEPNTRKSMLDLSSHYTTGMRLRRLWRQEGVVMVTCHLVLFWAPTRRSLVWSCSVDVRREAPTNSGDIDSSHHATLKDKATTTEAT